jgi:endonuclease YncB( thermonuclease family)
MGTHRFFILALVVWLAAACTLAKPPRTEMVSPTRVVVRTATPPATSVGPVEIEPTSTRTVRTPANTPQVRITGTIRPSPTVDPLACLPDNPGQTGLVSWVIDGETFVIDIGGRRETVRLLGIDAVPLTKDITRSLLDQRVVRLLPDGPTRDAQGHFLRYVLYLDGRFINDELLRSGAARLDIDAEGLACGAQFATAEEFATQEGLGLWG